jgi:sugar phosphate isomerase/epimerase
MQPGIFAKTFPRPTLAQTLDAVAQHGLRCVQFNMACAGLPPLPQAVVPEVVAQIRAETGARGITIAALSGTFNMAHPDPQVRRDGLASLRVLASTCAGIGTSLMTICTGSRDPGDMWRRHADNASPEAWRDMLDTLGAALATAQDAGVTLAFEPERANVVSSARRGRELLDTLASPHLKVVLDPSNLIDGRNPAAIPGVIDEAFDLLGDSIVLAHAKDRDPDGNPCTAGSGTVDFPRYAQRLRELRFDGAVVLHSLQEAEVAPSVRFLHTLLKDG